MICGARPDTRGSIGVIHEQKFVAAYDFLTGWLQANVLTWNTAAQWTCVFVSYGLTALLWRSFESRLFENLDKRKVSDLSRSILRAVVDAGNVAAFVVAMQVCAAVFQSLDLTPGVLDAASDLAVAWIVIRLVTSIMPNRVLARAVTALVWAVAALSIFGLLTPITDFLSRLSFSVGEAKFTALGVIKGVALAAIFLQAASLTAQFLTRRIESVHGLSPSLQVLLVKTFKVLLYTGAVLFAMSSVGIDLTSLAIFSAPWAWASASGSRPCSPTTWRASCCSWTTPSSRATPSRWAACSAWSATCAGATPRS